MPGTMTIPALLHPSASYTFTGATRPAETE